MVIFNHLLPLKFVRSIVLAVLKVIGLVIETQSHNGIDLLRTFCSFRIQNYFSKFMLGI